MSLSSLANTEWKINETPDITFYGTLTETKTFPVNFKSNGEFFSAMTVDVTVEDEGTEDETTVYTLYFGEKAIYVNGGTYPDAYRIASFIDGSDIDNAELIASVSYIATRIDITNNFRVIRKTLTGESQEYDFGTLGMQFLVKNLSDGDILVNFEDLTNDNATASALIPKETAQVIVTNTGYPKKEFSQIYVKGSGTGDVEIQMILW